MYTVLIKTKLSSVSMPRGKASKNKFVSRGFQNEGEKFDLKFQKVEIQKALFGPLHHTCIAKKGCFHSV